MFLIKKSFWEAKETKGKGQGIFAKKGINEGTVIGDYLGKVIKIEEYDLEEDQKGLYLMYLTDQAAIYPDLTVPGIHLLNHACEPNCWMYFYKGHTLFFAIRNINPGEELTISYLLSPKGNCDPCLHDCKCGSKKCSGTMHLTEEKYELWQKFQVDQKVKENKLKLVFNEDLPRLKSYPKFLPINPIYSLIV